MDHLALYLSDRCNLQCSYCYVAVNRGPAHRLSEGDVRAAVDRFCAEVPPGRRKVTFIGGEPLLDFPLLERAAAYAREACGPDAVLQTFTNGLLLTPERFAALERHGVHVTVSLDGRKEDNDARRVLAGGKAGSVYDGALAALKGLPKDRLGVSLVFGADSVERLLQNVDHFYRMGFWRITFNPDLYERWPDDKLAVLAKALDGLARYYDAVLDKGLRPFQIQILFALLEHGLYADGDGPWWKDCHNMVAGPDGNFYACDKTLSFPVGTAPADTLGSFAAGLDHARRKERYAEAADYILAQGFGKDEAFCPMGVVFHARAAGTDPRAALENFSRVSAVFKKGLQGLVERCRRHPAYQEVYERVSVV